MLHDRVSSLVMTHGKRNHLQIVPLSYSVKKFNYMFKLWDVLRKICPVFYLRKKCCCSKEADSKKLSNTAPWAYNVRKRTLWINANYYRKGTGSSLPRLIHFLWIHKKCIVLLYCLQNRKFYGKKWKTGSRFCYFM